MRRSKFLKISSIALLGGLVASMATAAETIKLGDMNAYTRLAAIAGPYKKGLDLGIK